MRVILVCGGAGFIGTQTCWALHDCGYQVVVLDNLSNGHKEFLPPEVIFYHGNIADENLLKQIFQKYPVSAIVHFAANIEAGISVQDPLTYYYNNVANTIKFLQFVVAAARVPLLFSSTAAVYNSQSNHRLTECDPINPRNPYGKSKWMIEQILSDTHAAHGLRYGVFRYFNAAGADPNKRCGELHDPETHLIPLTLQHALGQRENIKIFGNDYPTPDGTCVRDYIHVADLANAHILGLEYLLRQQQNFTLNLGNGQGYSVQQVIDTVQAIHGRTLNVQICDRRAGDPAVLVADASKAEKILGWKPHYPELAQMIQHAYQFATHQQTRKEAVPIRE